MAKSLTPRALATSAREALANSPVVFLGGPRQSGKSTLARELLGTERYITLDDAAPLAAATADPDGFIGGLDPGSVVDEIQRVPDLLRAVKAAIDRDRTPGRFLLTGSADVFALPRAAESLAGRMRVLTLWPFAEAELAGKRGRLIDALFAPTLRIDPPPATRRDVVGRVVRGGYPEVVALSAELRASWFESYVAAITLRDVRDLADVRGITQLPRLLQLLAARVGTILNAAEISRSSGIPQSTLGRYLSLLEATYLLRLIPAWSGSLSKRLVKHPKVVLSDSGLTAFLQGVDATRLGVDEQLAGPLLEAYCCMELLKLSSWSDSRPSLYHYRSHAGQEIDLLLERRDGSVVAVEIKNAAAPTARDFAAMRTLASELNRKFVRGVLLHPGRQVIPFGENLYAIPVSALWSV